MRIVNDSLTSFTDSTKRGDISSALIDPDPHTDYHMSSGGKGMVCADCHAASDHGFVGRRVDLRPNDVPARLTCTSCHEDRPHGDYDSRDGRARDTHAGHVACHSSLSDGPVRMDLQGEVGYELKGPASQVCRQCHGNKENMSFAKLHEKHVRDKRKDCSTCHNFSRPERGLSTSLNNP